MACRVKSLKPSEDDTQRGIVDGLRAFGYRVLVTSRRYRKCPQCGTVNHRGDGVSKGLADLVCRHPTWPRGVWVQLEVKKPGSIKYTSTEQKLAHVAGEIYVVQSLEQALEVLRSVRL